MIELKCQQCQKLFRVDNYLAARRKFCSMPCSTASRHEKLPHVICVACGKDFQVSRCFAESRRYCSAACRVKWNRPPFTCVKCRKQKTKDDFFRDPTMNNGVTSRCRDCYAEKHATINKFKPARHWSQQQTVARRRGLEWGLTMDQFLSFWGLPCTYCEDPIETIGLDRLDSSKGYVPGNVVPCCGICNRMKANMTVREFTVRCLRISNISLAEDRAA